MKARYETDSLVLKEQKAALDTWPDGDVKTARAKKVAGWEAEEIERRTWLEEN